MKVKKIHQPMKKYDVLMEREYLEKEEKLRDDQVRKESMRDPV